MKVVHVIELYIYEIVQIYYIQLKEANILSSN